VGTIKKELISDEQNDVLERLEFARVDTDKDYKFFGKIFDKNEQIWRILCK
jgi:hypothetical protein